MNKSLIVVGHRTETTRYRLLEPVRQYGLDRLWLAGEESTMRRRHLAWFAALVEQAEPELLGADQIIWLDRLEQDYANLSMALRFAAEGEAADIEVGLRLGGALWRFWDLRGYIAEGWERLIRLLALSSDAAAEARARAIFSAGMLALYRMDSQTAVALLEESLALWQKLGQQHGLALALQHLGFIAHRLGQPALARARYEEGLAVWRQLNEPWGLAETLGMLGNLAYWEGAYDKARMLQTESLQLKRQLNEKRGIAFSVWSLGKVAQAQGDYAEAYALYEEALITMHQLQDRGGLPFVLEALGYLAAAKGQAERAVRLLGAADSLRQAVGSMLPHISRADHDRYIADIRQQLSEVTFAAAWDAGQVMDLEQAVEYALQAG